MEESSVSVFDKIVSKEDFDEICRCCLSLTPVGSVFELIYEEIPLANIFYTLFGSQLDPSDDLPKKLCETCISEVVRSYNFKTKYEASEGALRNILAVKIEDVEIKSEPPKDNSEELGESRLDDNETCNDTDENLEQIVNKTRQRRAFTCSCEETFASKLEFRQHREVTNHHIPRTHLCKICGKLFSKLGLRNHVKTHEGIKRYRCEHCGKRFVSNSNLRRHIQIHTGEKHYACEFCAKSFIQLYSLQVHRRIHTGEKPYLCPNCGKGFAERDNCNVHMRNHSKQKLKLTTKFVCDKCGRSCSSQTAYKLHLYKHGLGEGQVVEDDQHECKICNKFYSSLNGLRMHMVRHKDKKFLCNECGKGFYTKNALRLHGLIHTGEKSLPCEFCYKKFARPESLQMHRYVHTGEKPYACHLCPKKFTQNSNLNRHLRSHTGEKPYGCKFCDKSFSMKDTLNTHLRTHTGEKPYQCDECSIKFCDVRSLNKHKKRKHQQI